MEKIIAGKKAIFKDKLTYLEFLDFADIAQAQEKGEMKQSEMIKQTLNIILTSYDGKMGKQGVEALMNIDDMSAMEDITQAFSEAVEHLTKNITKKKK